MRVPTCALFRADRRGNVTTMFALAILPVMGAVGVAVDYSQANSARSAMQAAVDATALMLSKEATSLSGSQINQKAFKYFTANFNRPKVTGVKVTPTLTKSDMLKLTVAASGSVPTNFMGVFGFKTLKIDVDSVVRWGDTKLRVALVLDNTGSMMSAGKITALKNAAKGFITQMQGAAAVNGDVYISIIPFASHVNVGKTNYGQTWINFADSGSWQGWDSRNGTCSVPGAFDDESCKTLKGTWTPANHINWNGCVTDREKNFDVTNTPPSASNKKTLFPAEQEPNCPVELMPLSYNWAALKAKVDSMIPVGMTNQTIGLQWGFQSLTSAPFKIPAYQPKFKYLKIVVLLTDGLNTQNRDTKIDPLLDTPSKKQAAIDKRTEEACKNIKAAGITLYTVQVSTDGDPMSQMLKNCASAPDKFFMLTSATAMVETFNKIATAISRRRIAE